MDVNETLKTTTKNFTFKFLFMNDDDFISLRNLNKKKSKKKGKFCIFHQAEDPLLVAPFA